MLIAKGLFVLESQCLCRLVAHLCRTKILYRARIYEVGLTSPLCAVANEILVWLAVKLHKSLAYHRLHLAVTLLHVHHHGDRNTSRNPLVNRLGCVLNGRHVACLACSDKHGSVETERVAVVSIKV